MVGENLCQRCMEVAFEQWTEREQSLVDFNGFFHRYRESGIDVYSVLTRIKND